MPLPIAAAGLGTAIGGAIMWALRIYAVSVIGRVFFTLGVGLFAYNYAVPEINSFIGSKFSALPDFVRQSVGAAGLDKLVTMIVSAYAVRTTARIMFGKRAD